MTRRASDAEAAEIKALSLRIIKSLEPDVVNHPHFVDAMLYTLTCTLKAQGRTVGELAAHLKAALALELD